jgi:methylmalonyl-CoA mutase
VLDPAGGSWFLDKITQELADEAWKLFQEIERQGGMAQALQSGWVAEQIAAAHARRAKDIALRKEGITGVSEFPNVAEESLPETALDRNTLRQPAVQRKQSLTEEGNASTAGVSPMAVAFAAATAGATIGQIARRLEFHKTSTTIEAIEARRFAQPFEELRDAVDAWEAAQGKRPTVFLATMGPVAHHTARATYSKNFFEAGGFRVVTGEGYKTADEAATAFTVCGASSAVICSSDKLYPDLVPAVTAQLKQAGAKTVVLAGNPGDKEAEWRSAGVDRFIFVKCDVLATLRDLLCEEGVIEA